LPSLFSRGGFFMGGKLKYYLLLHLIVLVWGFTGILGDRIPASADVITFLRTGISFLSLLLVGLFISDKKKLTSKQIAQLLLTGGIVGIHWFTFFYAIKASNVSIGVVCMSSSTLFTSIIEPIAFKRKFLLSELILSLAIIGGILVIFGFESHYYIGIISGLTSACLAALFTVLNGKFIAEVSSFQITKYEMLGGASILFLFLLFSGKVEMNSFSLPSEGWLFIFILGIICTTIAFMVSVWVMKFVTPFTVSMSVNMEPIYTIIIAVAIDAYLGTHKEQMSSGFYMGAAIILTAIFTNAYIKKRSNRKRRLLQNVVNEE
jgi:drug/metabolite transporter (DMT)-like permease